MKQNKTESYTTPIIVVARSDGRGGIKPFGTYGKQQAGAKVFVGEKSFTVTKDGRVNIPKSIMDTGIKGSDGRMRISIGFRAESKEAAGIDRWKSVKSIIVKPSKEDKNAVHGDKITKFRLNRKGKNADLKPLDTKDYNWSP